ncbi:dephospho-CoA kinase [soil metagenome]
MTTLGLTGGIGSGKSAAARFFAELPGVRVIVADDVAKRLMQQDPEVRESLIAHFGHGTFDSEGRLNRARLAERVFGDAAELAALNAIVHPAVRKRMLNAMDAARRDGVRLLVYEAALVFESGADAWLDAVAVVDAPIETRIERAMSRDAVPRAAVEARMRHQLPAEALLSRAHHVIQNDGSLDDLRENVGRLYATLVGAPQGG